MFLHMVRGLRLAGVLELQMPDSMRCPNKGISWTAQVARRVEASISAWNLSSFHDLARPRPLVTRQPAEDNVDVDVDAGFSMTKEQQPRAHGILPRIENPLEFARRLRGFEQRGPLFIWSHRASASMSRVARGRPRIDAAMPPTIIAGTPAASSQCVRSARAVTKSRGIRSVTGKPGECAASGRGLR